jgi:tetratricopeptide (TPR) repeat protein
MTMAEATSGQMTHIVRGSGNGLPPAGTTAPAPVDYQEALPSLQAAYSEDPSPAHRHSLALAYVRSGQPDRAHDVLLPHWEEGMTPAEMRLVLEADRALGHEERARRLAQSLGDDSPAVADAMLWALVAFTCLDLGYRDDGVKALEAAIALDPENISLQSHRAFLVNHPTE